MKLRSIPCGHISTFSVCQSACPSILLNLLALNSLLGLCLVKCCSSLLQLVKCVKAGDDIEEQAGEPEACCLLGELLCSLEFPDARCIKL